MRAYELGLKQEYMMQMRPVLKKRALYSDGTANYVSPAEPAIGDEVTIRFRTGVDNVDMVWLHYGENRTSMELVEKKGEFDYYETKIKLGSETFVYCFEVATGFLHCYYDRGGVTREIRGDFQFKIAPGFKTPDWAKGAVMYQIFVDRFYNGDKTNDVVDNEYYYIRTGSKHMENWNQVPSNFSVAEFYGGDLEGVRQKLDYLQDLGIEVIYFNPLFVSPSNHKYDAQDYEYIDPHYGKIVNDGGEALPEGVSDNRQATKYIKRVTDLENLEASNKFFAELVSEIHARGMRVIIDGVFNHCGSFHKWLDREEIYSGKEGFEPGAYVDRESPYHNYFGFQDANAWPYNTTYEGWWGHDTLPKINYDASPEAYEHIMSIAKKWVSAPYNVDGWRLDVAADLGHSAEFNHKFWKDFRKNVKEANPNAIVLAEHYGDARSWLGGDEWDTLMNYDAFMEPVTWFLTGMEKHSDSSKPELQGDNNAFNNAMDYFMTQYLTPSLYCSMNQLSNHDHSRFLTRTNRCVGRIDSKGAAAASEGVNKGIFKEAVVMQMTWPGAPTLYYGDEAGVCGFTDPDNRRTYPWGHEDTELIDFHKKIIAIHKKYEMFRTGSVKHLNSSHNYLAYCRFNSNEQAVIIINNNGQTMEVKQSVWAAEVPMECEMTRVMMTTSESFSDTPIRYPVCKGKIEIVMPPYSAAVLIRQN